MPTIMQVRSITSWEWIRVHKPRFDGWSSGTIGSFDTFHLHFHPPLPPRQPGSAYPRLLSPFVVLPLYLSHMMAGLHNDWKRFKLYQTFFHGHTSFSSFVSNCLRIALTLFIFFRSISFHTSFERLISQEPDTPDMCLYFFVPFAQQPCGSSSTYNLSRSRVNWTRSRMVSPR